MEVLTEEATEWLLAIRPSRRNASRQPLVNPEYWMDIFVQGSFRCEFHDVWQKGDQTTGYSRSDLTDIASVADQFGRNHVADPAHQPVARLQIAKIERASPEAVLKVLKASGVDLAAVLLLLRSPWFHFQHFQTRDDQGLRTTFCLSRDDTRMAWVYHHTSHITRGVLFQGNAQSPQLSVNFQRFRRDVLHPLALVYFHEYRVIREFEDSCHWIKAELSDLEEATGHKFFPSRHLNESKPPGLDLAELSRKTSALNLQILRIRSWVKDAETLCDEVRKLSVELQDFNTKCLGPAREEWESSINWQAKRLEALREHTIFLKARIDIQNHVIFNLISQEDARQGIVLSRSSTELASAAKADSSSMQTIAVMTMAFLPGTFFAALFAMPLLQWDQSTVLQEKFWIYWAFTIPSTLLVFVVWGFVRHPWPAAGRHAGRRETGHSPPETDSFTQRKVLP